MERKIPKNVRQIGNVSDTPKIYVEDYVDTFFSQMSEVAKERPIGAFLVGDIVETEEGEFVYIHGAIQMHDLKMNRLTYVLDEATWKDAKDTFSEYFDEGELVGWIVVRPKTEEGLEAAMTDDVVVENVTKLHKLSFPKENTIFIRKTLALDEEQYYVHKCNQLMEIAGHFTYYEKNPCMQNYMISCRKKNGVCPTEIVEDQAAKNFRSIVRAREQYTRENKRGTGVLKYFARASMWIVVLVLGMFAVEKYEGISLKEMLQKGSWQIELEQEKKQQKEMPQKSESENTVECSSNNQVYIVKEGDSLARISTKVYGDSSHMEEICKKNGLTKGSLIYVGQKLILP